MVCVPDVDLCVSSYCLSQQPPHRALVRSARSFAPALAATQFQLAPLLIHPKNEMLLAAFCADLMNDNLVGGEFNPTFPRPSTPIRPPLSSSDPAPGRKGSFYANPDSSVVWLVV